MSNCFPPVALLISSYNRPRHLALALTSIEHQRHDPAGMEVVITDDGSDSDTLAVVADYAARAKWAVKLTTHSHAAFQLARCRNEGVLASRAPYLLFLDGDCILPPDHVAQHLRRRRSGMVMAGDCCRLGANISRQIDDVAIRDGQFLEWESRAERRRLRNQYRKSLMYNLLHHPTKPKLTGNNIGIWRQDYEQINGFDEHYEGWGCEDNDLQVRLRRVGIRVASILKWTHSYHLWHPPALSCPGRWHDGTNVTYLENARYRPVRCNHGLQYFCCQPDMMVAKRPVWRTGLLRNVARSLTSGAGPCSPHVEAPKEALGSTAARRTITRRPFAEILFHPGQGDFSGQATWNVLVAQKRDIVPLERAATADVVVNTDEMRDLPDQLRTLEAEDRKSRGSLRQPQRIA